ncbi:hypothetical protein O3M35_008144 [Rhynocoris fuscipes]|uniref:Methylcrotonoyl-CoA carboxylase n=1 Tax=Rhynocoris fuscipes TaxID=488301 RepID=A0AAW1D831_9HEMI
MTMSISNLAHLKKILIANRGEIACRIMKTAKRLGIQTVAVYSDIDVNSMHVQMADEAYNIGPAQSQESYLRGDKIIKVATQSLAQAIHPGYGFLSENAEFAKLCSDNGVIFIGPPASAIRDMGIKSTSKNIMDKAGVPIVPGYHGEKQSDDDLLERAKEIGFPLMIKAVRGGGGKGMRIVGSESEFKQALDSARTESLRAFGDNVVLLEKFVVNPRHIEVQIFGDSHGNYVHLFERDCSIQRRHQKVIEQAPAPGINEETRYELGKFAVKAAEAVKYEGAGTVEFIYDKSINKFYFMEMNTRLQVEHPVTEMITGIDLVEWQLRVASGETLPLAQDEISLNGSAVEARIYAENVSDNFLPTAGHIQNINTPEIGSNLRVETGIRSGDDVSVHYDPMIAKLVVWDKDGKQVFRTLEQSLSEFNIVGVENNVDFLRKLCKNQDLIEGNIHTGFIEDHKANLSTQLPSENIFQQIALAAILLQSSGSQSISDPFSNGDSFRINSSSTKKITLISHGKEFIVNIKFNNDASYDLKIGESVLKVKNASLNYDNGFVMLRSETSQNILHIKLGFSGSRVYVFDKISGDHVVELKNENDWLSDNADTTQVTDRVVSPMPGIIEKIHVKKGDLVKKGDSLAVIIAMKMEYVIKSQQNRRVEEVYFSPGDNVGKNVSIIKFAEVS